jgi:hypothetical protein
MRERTQGGKGMKPYAVYVFDKLPETATRYILKEHSGADIDAFPAIWRQKWHPHVGEKYIVFRETQDQRPGQQFTHSLSLEKNRMVTGLNFTPEFPQLSWGDYRNDAILVEFSVDWTELTLMFFKDMKNQAYSLFERGIAGELVEISECDILPLPMSA